MILEAKFTQHLPLNHQSDTLARGGIDLVVSKMADWVGACAAGLSPLLTLIRDHVRTAARIHGDTTVPVHAKGHSVAGRLWTYVRDDRPFGGPAPPAALFSCSRARGSEHPRRHIADCAEILPADAYSGYATLSEPACKPGPITEGAYWAHGRRHPFKLADLAKTLLAIVAARRIDTVFAVERDLNGISPTERLAARPQHLAPLVADLEVWMRAERARMSRPADVAKAMDYMLKRWPSFTQLVEDGCICMTNNAAERALRDVALGRKSWLFAGSDREGERAAAFFAMIVSAKLNNVDPRTWLADVLQFIADCPSVALDKLFPWHWKETRTARAA